MPVFSHAHTDDPLGLATAAGVVLRTLEGGPVSDWNEVKSTAGYYITAGVKEMKPRNVYRMTYEVMPGNNLTVPLGVLVNSDFYITSMSVDQNSTQNVRVTVEAVEPSDPTMFNAYETESYTITGGFGVQNKFGSTSTDCFITGSLSVSMEFTEDMHETSGDFCIGGIRGHSFKENHTQTAYGPITLKSNARRVRAPIATESNASAVHTAEWFFYPNGV